VVEIIRELLHQMVWFADVMIYAFVHVAKGLSEEFRQSSHRIQKRVVLQVSNADKFVAERLSCVLRLPNRKGCR
jgi:hypothetical protein